MAGCAGEAAVRTASGIACQARASRVRGGAEALASPRTEEPALPAMATDAVGECTRGKHVCEGVEAQLAARTMPSSNPRCPAAPASRRPRASQDRPSGALGEHLALARTSGLVYQGETLLDLAEACAGAPASIARAGTTGTPPASQSRGEVQPPAPTSPASSGADPGASRWQAWPLKASARTRADTKGPQAVGHRRDLGAAASWIGHGSHPLAGTICGETFETEAPLQRWALPQTEQACLVVHRCQHGASASDPSISFSFELFQMDPDTTKAGALTADRHQDLASGTFCFWVFIVTPLEILKRPLSPCCHRLAKEEWLVL